MARYQTRVAFAVVAMALGAGSAARATPVVTGRLAVARPTIVLTDSMPTTPVPESATLVMVGVGLTVVAATLLRRRDARHRRHLRRSGRRRSEGPS
jgi:hypothetical protein